MKKGFTLIELLGVITILAILLTLTMVITSSVIKDSKDTVYQNQINSILNATYDYTLKFPNILPKNKNDVKYIPLSELEKNNFIDELVNPKTKEKFPLDLVISIKYTGGNVKHDNNSILRGNYLYKVEIDKKDETNYDSLKPVITIDGLEKDSDGNYTRGIPKGSKYEANSTTSTGSDMYNIKYNNKEEIVKEVNSLKLEIYYVYHIAVNKNGYSNMIKEIVTIVPDSESPILTIPENAVIQQSVTSFDLDEGVSCTDNSGECKITHTGSITFGTPGSYVITYTGTDPSGNSVSKSRTIRVN